MKPEEFRIGNWILAEREEWCINEVTSNLDHSIYEPIPLTDEWLDKFGFELDEETEMYNLITPLQFIDYSFEIIKNAHDRFYQWRHIKVKYVHQLQNLYFALTNEELILNGTT